MFQRLRHIRQNGVLNLVFHGAEHSNAIMVDGSARDVVESYLLALEQMYAAIYFHHTNRAASFLLRAIIERAVDLARSSEDIRAQLFPTHTFGEDPLWRIVLEGQKVPLEVYEALDENHVWALISMWTRFQDPILAKLSSDIKSRRFPKAITIRKDEVLSRDLDRIGERARELFRAKPPDQDPKYFTYIDKAMRKAYPGGAWEDNYANSIKLLFSTGRWEAVEENERSVADEAEKLLEGSRS